MKRLPADVAACRRTPLFTETTLPDSLRRAHTTRADTWALIVVTEGTLRYRILEPSLEEHVLTLQAAGVVEPGVRHEVEPVGAVRFYVEFYRAADGAAPDATCR